MCNATIPPLSRTLRDDVRDRIAIEIASLRQGRLTAFDHDVRTSTLGHRLSMIAFRLIMSLKQARGDAHRCLRKSHRVGISRLLSLRQICVSGSQAVVSPHIL